MPTTPDWAKHAVWYQIFPERFRNGDLKNDPQLKDQDGAYPFDQKSPWQIHHWGSDWYQRQPYEQQNKHDIWHNILRRRYGGDLQGILDKLDYLQDLGINAIYLNPVFASPSLHKYDGLCYHHIDPNFGPEPEKDREIIKRETFDDPSTWQWTHADKLMLELIAEVHRREMHIIFDGVFNHLSWYCVPFVDLKKHQQKSRFVEWFQVNAFADKKKGTEFNVNCWWNVTELPALNQDKNGTTALPRKYIFAATRRWMAPVSDVSAGIDGWRLDVAFEIAHPFWKDWRKLVKSINPDAYLTAELIDTIDGLKPYLSGDEFDAIMHYNFAMAAADFFITGKTTSASTFSQHLHDLRKAFGEDIAYVQQNLFDSHDTPRIISYIQNAQLEHMSNWSQFHVTTKANNPLMKTVKPSADDFQKLKLLATLQMTYVGAPMIYYGDEVGMWGANDPCCRKPMVWDDIDYADEKYVSSGKIQGAGQPVQFDNDLHAYYKKLIAIRNEHNALQIGDFVDLNRASEPDIFKFSRTLNDQTFVVVLNRTGREVITHINAREAQRFTDLIEGKSHSVASDNALHCSIAGHAGLILKQENGEKP